MAGAIAPVPSGFGFTDHPGRLCGRGRVHQLHAVQTFVQETTTLGERDRDGDDPPNVGKIGPIRREKIKMDVEHMLQLK